MRGWCSGWRKGCAQSSRGRRATCSTSVGCSTESFAIRLARRQRALLEKRYAAATCVRRITTRAHADQLVGSLDALPHGVRSHATKSPCRLHPERAAGGGMKQSGARASFGRRGGPGGSWARPHRFGGAPRLPGGAAGGRTFAQLNSGIHSPMRSLGGSDAWDKHGKFPRGKATWLARPMPRAKSCACCMRMRCRMRCYRTAS